MSISDLDKAFELIKENFDESETDFCQPQSTLTIKSAENTLGCFFPKSYKKFLEKHGCGGVGSFEVYGLLKDENFTEHSIPPVCSPNMVWTTLKDARDYNHPKNLPIIYNVGEGSLYCLDTSKMTPEGECPVVVWPIGGYEQTPVLEIIAEDFGRFFLDMVKHQIDYKKSSHYTST